MKLKHIVNPIKTASQNEEVSKLLKIMQKEKISSLVVLNKKKKISAIITETDAIKAVAMGLNLDGVLIKDFLSKQKLFTLSEDTPLSTAFNMMEQKGYRHVIGVDEEGNAVGIATQSDFLKYLDTKLLIRIKTVNDVMTKDVISVEQNYSVNDAAMIMYENKISSLIIVNKDEKVVGIITERDMVKFANKKEKLLLKEVMSSPVKTVQPNSSLSDVLDRMQKEKIRRLVVVNKDRTVAGLITRTNILRSIESKKVEILSQTLKQKNYELEVIKKQDEELKLLDIALKSSANAVVITDINAKIKWCNKAFEELTGYEIDEAIGKKPKELVKSGMQSKEFYDSLWKTILAKNSFKGEVVNKKKNGELYNENLTITPLVDATGQITHFVAVKEDITELKQLQQSIIESEKRFKNLFEHAPLPYQSLDIDGYIVEVNSAWLEMTGYRYNEVIGTNFCDYIVGKDKALLKNSYKKFFNDERIEGEIFELLTKKGKKKVIEINGKLATTQKGSFTHCLISDVTEKKAMQDRIYYIAHNDTLTGLPNRVSLHEEIAHALARAKRNKTVVALLVVGLDSFKDINDSFGHKIGDDLLNMVANELKLITNDELFIARVAGDEFAILLEDVKNDDDSAIVAHKVISGLSKTWSLGNKVTIYLNATMGIATYPIPAKNEIQLFQYSDAALFLAKKENRGKYRFYNDAITAQARKNVDILASLKESIIKDEFVVYYQPQIDIKTQKLIGVESLVRWKQNSKIIPPGQFIELAEQRGLISGITEFVLKQTCKDLQEFIKLFGSNFKASINLSALELHETMFQNIVNIVNTHKIKSKNLGIEITESIFINDINQAVKILHKYKKEGFLISLDDFGIGYSSLHYLKKLPVDILKIDKSFIDGLPHDNDDNQITKAILSMAQTLGMSVLAEGVETKQQLEFLQNLECDFYQGYYCAKPLPKQQLLNLNLNSYS